MVLGFRKVLVLGLVRRNIPVFHATRYIEREKKRLRMVATTSHEVRFVMNYAHSTPCSVTRVFMRRSTCVRFEHSSDYMLAHPLLAGHHRFVSRHRQGGVRWQRARGGGRGDENGPENERNVVLYSLP